MAKTKRIGTVDEVHCATCKVPTRHTIRDSYETRWDDGDSGVCGGATHDFLSCNGCESATYRRISWFSEEPGEDSTSLWPPRGDGPNLRTAKDYDSLYGTPLESVYRQTVAAYNHKLPTLTAAGVRLLIEGLCNERRVTDGEVTDEHGTTKRSNNLEGKINGMVEHGLIGKKQSEVLHQIRALGNEAAHELYQPSRDVLQKALDIVEAILTQVYEHPEHAKALAARKVKGHQQS